MTWTLSVVGHFDIDEAANPDSLKTRMEALMDACREAIAGLPEQASSASFSSNVEGVSGSVLVRPIQ
jgi:hypothetical protein